MGPAPGRLEPSEGTLNQTWAVFLGFETLSLKSRGSKVRRQHSDNPGTVVSPTVCPAVAIIIVLPRVRKYISQQQVHLKVKGN